MIEKKDIEKLDEIRLLVDTFYSKVRDDKLLAPIFEKVIADLWEEHLDKMYRFWQTVLLAKQTYSGSPFPPHNKLLIDEKHYDRRLDLFSSTLNELFTGNKAEEAQCRAQKMARMFQSKLDHLRNNYNNLPL